MRTGPRVGFFPGAADREGLFVRERLPLEIRKVPCSITPASSLMVVKSVKPTTLVFVVRLPVETRVRKDVVLVGRGSGNFLNSSADFSKAEAPAERSESGLGSLLIKVVAAASEALGPLEAVEEACTCESCCLGETDSVLKDLPVDTGLRWMDCTEDGFFVGLSSSFAKLSPKLANAVHLFLSWDINNLSIGLWPS